MRSIGIGIKIFGKKMN
jgi:hypothetical protein